MDGINTCLFIQKDSVCILSRILTLFSVYVCAIQVFKGFIPIGKEIDIPVVENIHSLTLCLITKKYIPESEIEIRQVEGAPINFTTTRHTEWDEIADNSKRTVMIARIENPPQV